MNTPSYILEFKRDNGNVVQIHAVDFSEDSEHVELATRNDGAVYMRDPIDGAWCVHTFTGV